MGSYGEMDFSKLENRGVKIFRRNFSGKLLGEFRVEWVFVHPDPMSAETCRRGEKKKQKENMNIKWLCVVSGKQGRSYRIELKFLG